MSQTGPELSSKRKTAAKRSKATDLPSASKN